MIQFHRYGPMDHVALGSPMAEERLGMISGAFYSQGMDAERSRMAVQKVLDGQITQRVNEAIAAFFATISNGVSAFSWSTRTTARSS